MLQTLFLDQEPNQLGNKPNRGSKIESAVVFNPENNSKSQNFSGNDDCHLVFSDFCQATLFDPKMKVGDNSLEKSSEKFGLSLSKFDQFNWDSTSKT